MRRRVHEILDESIPTDVVAHWVQGALVLLIVANVAALILETVPALARGPIPALQSESGTFWHTFEFVSLVVFAVEYVLRLWSCVEDPRFQHPLRGRVQWIMTPLALVDLATILPAVLLFIDVDLRTLRLLRLLRFLRISRLGRYSEAMRVLGMVIRQQREQLISCLALMAMLITVAGSFMYFAENEAQPDRFGSIPDGLWWAVTTLTTVGYGDLTPVTATGRMIAAAVAILGIATFALPAGILGAAFADEMRRVKEQRQRALAATSDHTCPHCGQSMPAA